MNKIYSLPLAILLFSACSTKEMPTTKKMPTVKAKPSLASKKTTSSIVAIQPKTLAKQITKAPIGAEITKTPILVKNTPVMNLPTQRIIRRIEPIIEPITEAFTEPILEPNIEPVRDEPIMQTMIQPAVSMPIMSQEPIKVVPSFSEPIPQYEVQNNLPTYQHTSQDEPSTGVQGGGLQGDFSGNYNLVNFIDRMVNEQGFDRNYLNEVFSQAQNTNNFIKPYREPSSTYISGAWDRYKQNFIYERNIQRGIKFWNKYRATLERATAEYGVPAEYIVGIIGIETAYGVNFGKKKVLDVLTTKSMLPDRRNSFYTKQLEKFLVMTRQSNLNPTELMGSNAGAMGYGQFIPSSYLEFAVDFNGDGTTDLWNAEDAIGSIANYFARNGWNSSIGQVAIRAKYNGNRFKRLKTGYKTKYSQYKLRKKYKIKPRTKMRYSGPVSLLKLNRASHDELWFGTHNFRVLTTYNHSSHYGMAVFQLGKEVKKRRGGYYSSL